MGNNTELQKKYNDNFFNYSCPECRNQTKNKKRVSKDIRKRAKLASKTERQEKRTNGEVCSSGSGSIENRKYNDVEMTNGAENHDYDAVEGSMLSVTENDKKSASDLNGPSYSGINKKKVRGIKRRRNDEDYMDNASQRDPEYSLEDFMVLRSLKIAKEREDIVEPRSLGLKVAQF